MGKTHGMSNSRQYKIWQQIKVRCDDPNAIKYHIYGGNGITYPDKWKTFEGFWEDMRDGYADNLTIDRIDNSKSYSADNCRWVSYSEQNMNRSCNVGYDVKCLIDKTGLPKTTIYRWIKNGNLLANIEKRGIAMNGG